MISYQSGKREVCLPAGTEEQTDGSPQEPINLTDPILQVPLVAKMSELRVVYVEQERRWIAADLSAIIDPELAPGMAGRRVLVLRLLKNLVQLGGRKADQPFFLNP